VVTRSRTLAALAGAATVAALVAMSLERHVVRGESMKPTLRPRDTAISVKVRSPLGRVLGLAHRPRPGDIAIIELPWEHDLIGIKRLVAGPGEGWVAVGDQRTLSTDSRHHGRVPEGNVRGVMLAKVGAPGPG
jgi:signal peptidase I